MGSLESLELERLIDSPNLIAPFSYSNPLRDSGIFYDFISKYSSFLEVPIFESKVGFFYEKKRQVRNVCECLVNSDLSFSQRIFYGVGESLGFLFPFYYPFFGTVGSCRKDEDSIFIALPNFSGVRGLIYSDKPHEYLHAYHMLVSEDLFRRGLIDFDGFSGAGLLEPQHRIPTEMDLKRFERKILSPLISKVKASNRKKL